MQVEIHLYSADAFIVSVVPVAHLQPLHSSHAIPVLCAHNYEPIGACFVSAVAWVALAGLGAAAVDVSVGFAAHLGVFAYLGSCLWMAQLRDSCMRSGWT